MAEKVDRGRSLGAQVADIVRQRIVRGELRVGERLTEEALAEEFEVSRGSVREAITQLTYERLVELRRPRGVYIVGLTDDDVAQLYSLRGALERLAVQRAMANSASHQWRRTARCVEDLKRAADAGDHPGYQEADLEFHSMLYDLADHPRLCATWKQYEPTFAALLEVTINHDEDLHESAEAHERFYEVLRSGDVPRALDELSAHLEGAEKRMRLELAARG